MPDWTPVCEAACNMCIVHVLHATWHVQPATVHRMISGFAWAWGARHMKNTFDFYKRSKHTSPTLQRGFSHGLEMGRSSFVHLIPRFRPTPKRGPK